MSIMFSLRQLISKKF